MFSRSSSTLLRQRKGSSLAAATINGGLQALSETLLQPVIILAAIAFLFGGSNIQIAAFTTITAVAWALAPLAMSLIRRMTSRGGLIVLVVSIVRLTALLFAGFAAVRIDDIPTSRFLGLLIGAYIVYQSGTALSSQASAGAAAIATGGNLTRRMVRYRRLTAVVAALIAALVAWSVLNSDLAFQHAVRQIVLLATLSAIAAIWFLLQIRRNRTAVSQRSPGGTLASALAAFRVAAFRRFAGYKILLALAAAVDPFLIVFGFRELGLDVQYIGLALVALVVGHAAGAYLWPRWIARSGPRAPFQVAALFRLVLLLWLIAIPGVLTNSLYTDRFDDGTAAMRGFAIGFVLLGLAGSAGTAANQRYLMNLTRPESLAGATMSINVLMAICGFGPLVVARLLNDYDLDHILWGATACAAVALFASGLLVESTVRVRTPVGTWRSTRHAANGA